VFRQASDYSCTVDRNASQVRSTEKGNVNIEQQSFRIELDSDADTCCVGNGVMIVMIVNATDRYVTDMSMLHLLSSR
jgi:hypothetical protein